MLTKLARMLIYGGFDKQTSGILLKNPKISGEIKLLGLKIL